MVPLNVTSLRAGVLVSFITDIQAPTAGLFASPCLCGVLAGLSMGIVNERDG